MSSVSAAKQQRKDRYAFLCHKPIYGSTDAPLRWYAKFARHLGRFQYYPHKVDLCLFSKRNAVTGELVAVLVFHVDDLIMAGTNEEHVALRKCLGGFKHGEVQKTSTKGANSLLRTHANTKEPLDRDNTGRIQVIDTSRAEERCNRTGFPSPFDRFYTK